MNTWLTTPNTEHKMQTLTHRIDNKHIPCQFSINGYLSREIVPSSSDSMASMWDNEFEDQNAYADVELL